MAPEKPKRWRTLRTPDGQRPSPRQAQRDARMYAEQWYQALRDWKVVAPVIIRPRISYAAFRSGWGDPITTMGDGAPDRPSGLELPSGTAREVEVGRTISTWAVSRLPAQQELGGLLARIRASQSPRSLIDERGGWASPRDRSVAYAVAVLTLAVTLGDRAAEIHLLHLRKSGD